MGVGGQHHALGHFTAGKETRYPFYRRLDVPQGQSGWVQKILPPTGIQSLDRPASTELLYLMWLSVVSQIMQFTLQSSFLWLLGPSL